MTRCALLVRPRCYDGFYVLCNFGVLRLPANDITLDREQLRKDDQHVLEHHQFHVSVFNFLSPSFFFPFSTLPQVKSFPPPPRDFSKFSTRRRRDSFLPALPVESRANTRTHALARVPNASRSGARRGIDFSRRPGF